MKRFVHFFVKKRIGDWENINDQEVRSRYGSLEGWVSIFVNLFLFLLKSLLGFITGSVSLIADGFHTLSDVATSIVMVISFKLSKRPSDESHPYGHGRMEAIAAVIVAVLLLVTGVEIFKGALERIVHPRNFDASWLVIMIIASTVVIKELLARFSKELGVMIGSPALEADFWHHRTDAISSVLVICAFIFQRFGITIVDGVAGIVVSVMIGFTGWKIARKGIDDLLGSKPSDELVQNVKATVRSFPDIIDVHDLIIHQYGKRTLLSFHIVVSEEIALKQAHALADEVGDAVNKKFLTHSTVHIDPVNIRDPELMKMQEYLKMLIDECEGSCSFHDFRIADEGGSKNILFDLTVDPQMKEKEIEKLKQKLQDGLLDKFPSFIGVVIEVEPRYAL